MLCFVVKNDNQQKSTLDDNNDLICSYYIKTLMLWACENVSPEKWNSVDLLCGCCHLLAILAGWIEERNCPHYFILGCNMFRKNVDIIQVQMTMQRLREFDETVHGQWFVFNYISKVIRDASESPCNVQMSECSYRIQFMSNESVVIFLREVSMESSTLTTPISTLMNAIENYLFVRNKHISQQHQTKIITCCLGVTLHLEVYTTKELALKHYFYDDVYLSSVILNYNIDPRMTNANSALFMLHIAHTLLN